MIEFKLHTTSVRQTAKLNTHFKLSCINNVIR